MDTPRTGQNCCCRVARYTVACAYAYFKGVVQQSPLIPCSAAAAAQSQMELAEQRLLLHAYDLRMKTTR